MVAPFMLSFLIGAAQFHIDATRLYVCPLLGLAAVWLLRDLRMNKTAE